MTPPVIRRDRDAAWVAGLAACVSLAAFLTYFRHAEALLYGDAVAHLHIARRVFDSRTPGLLQLGTVWLPLPHLLLIPFLLSDWMWRTGVGGSIPSLIAYIAGVLGIFRLVRGALAFQDQPDKAARWAAWFATFIYAANPNLLYLQATAMTEAVYLAFFVWAMVYFSEFAQGAGEPEEMLQTAPPRSLTKCGLCLAGAELTRYDGWFAAAALIGAALLVVCRKARGDRQRRRAAGRFILLTAAVPVFWLSYNGLIYRNPLEFANGPYSARAIEQRSIEQGVTPHPGSRSLRVASAYFLKSAEYNLGEGNWQKAWVGTLVLGSVVAVMWRRMAMLLLLWVPLPFYGLSIAYGGVPLYVPVWWPYSLYNVRYGLQLLPAAAVLAALAVYSLALLTRRTALRITLGLAAVGLVAGSYASVWRAQPVCFREAWVNSRTRLAFEAELAAKLRRLPPESTLLMYLGNHPGALLQAGIPLRRVIQEGNHRVWKQPSDPEGFWERALADPARYADYVVAIAGDPVSQAVPAQSLPAVDSVEVAGQPRAVLYRTGRSAR